MLDQEVGNTVLRQAIAKHKEGKMNEAFHMYNALLNADPDNPAVLFCIGDFCLQQNHTGLAVNLYSNLLRLTPRDSDAWCNLGIAYRYEDRYEDAFACWNRAIEIAGDTPAVCSNMANLYCDRAKPYEALHWIRRALAKEPGMIEAHWQEALAYLTLRDWPNGWDAYEYRLKQAHFDTRKSLNLEYWDWQPTEHLYVHGEQGIGDEIMFLSCLDEVLPLAKRVTVEVNPKVAGIVRHTWPQVNVRTEVGPGDYTAKVAIGSLAARLRRSQESFPRKPYLKPDPALIEHYRQRLAGLGEGPYVALAWAGGSKRTRVEDRSFKTSNLRMLLQALEGFTCVSGQYEHSNPFIRKDREDCGLIKFDDESSGTDMHHQAALFKACDAVVTVQQTAVHVAGSVGTPCFVMVNSTPHWRYGLEGDMPWYSSVRLIRQKTHGDWASVIGEVETSLAHHEGIRRAQSADARAA